MNQESNERNEKRKGTDRRALMIGGAVLAVIVIVLIVVLGKNGKQAATTEPAVTASSETAEQEAAGETDAAAEPALPFETQPKMTAPDGSEFIPDSYVDQEIEVLNPENRPSGYAESYNGEDLTGTWKETTVGTATMELKEDGSGSFTSAGVQFTWYADNENFIIFYDPMYGNTVPSQFEASKENGKLVLKEIAQDGAIFVKD